MKNLLSILGFFLFSISSIMAQADSSVDSQRDDVLGLQWYTSDAYQGHVHDEDYHLHIDKDAWEPFTMEVSFMDLESFPIIEMKLYSTNELDIQVDVVSKTGKTTTISNKEFEAMYLREFQDLSLDLRTSNIAFDEISHLHFYVYPGQAYKGHLSIKDISVKSVDEASSANNFTIFPNPSNGNITVSNISAEFDNIKIFDGRGRLVSTKNMSKTSQESLDVSHLQNGIYFLQISNGDQILKLRSFVR